MNEVTYTAIVLKATDYRENDKLVRLLSLENGVITAVFKGVKKAAAKLKFAAQPFAFGEFRLIQSNNGFFTAIGCVPLGDYYPITQSPDKFVCGALMLEAADHAALGNDNPSVFTLLISALKTLTYTDISENLLCAQYLLKLLDSLGYSQEYLANTTDKKTNIAGVLGILKTLPMGELESFNVSDSLSYKAVKMQCGRFSNKLDIDLKSSKFLHIQHK